MDGEIIDYQLKSPFVYLRQLVRNLSFTSGNGAGGSEQIREGAGLHREDQCQDELIDYIQLK